MFAHVLCGLLYGLMSEVNCCNLFFFWHLKDLLIFAFDFLYSIVLSVFNSLLSYHHFLIFSFLKSDRLHFSTVPRPL